MSRPTAAKAYLQEASERFRGVHAALGKVVHKTFPKAEETFTYGMPGWRVKRRSKPDPHAPKGTIDPNFIFVLLVERKAGITLHLWNPADHGGLQKRRKELEAAGFKVMVGCIQFNRKGEFPLTAVGKLLADAKAADK